MIGLPDHDAARRGEEERMARRGRRANGEGSVYQRKDGRWIAQLCVGFTPAGRPRYAYRYAKTQKEAVARLDELRREHAQGLSVDAKRQTVADFLQKWLEEVARPRVRPKTYRSYEQLVRVHLSPSLGRHQLAKLTPLHV